MEKKRGTIAQLIAHSFSASLDEVELRDGQIRKRIRIDHPEAVAVIPLLSDSEIVMVRQFRYAIGKDTLEIPAGKVDPGEKPLAAVHRELLEETGYKADNIGHLCSYQPAIGYSNEIIHVYVARGLQKITRTLDEAEISSCEVMDLGEVRQMVADGKIMDGKTMLALGLI